MLNVSSVCKWGLSTGHMTSNRIEHLMSSQTSCTPVARQKGNSHEHKGAGRADHPCQVQDQF